ncbi:oligosaccharide flippase family protein, partial [Tritonibacter sp. SIMBA_163]|uniref:oligosaccharide flippase family protein n=1 Tax=Tritonibacter sp. SIMBA_163 TaxID=3080868 RepID=UPI00398186C0
SRILTPEDFGITSLSSAIIGFLTIFSLMGVGPALIQKKELTEEQIKISFFLSLFLGMFFSTMLYLSASLLADFFNI